MIIYIAGPMTGIKDYNFPAFFDMEALLDKRGHIVLNPARGPVLTPGSIPYEVYLELALVMVRACNCIVTLDGWQSSAGASTEVAYAVSLKKKIMSSREL